MFCNICLSEDILNKYDRLNLCDGCLSNVKTYERDVFVYGSLLNLFKRQLILGKNVQVHEDSLVDYKITPHSVMLIYPTIVKSAGDVVKGVVFKASEDDLKKLDRYETSLYKKINVTLQSGKTSLVYIES